MLKRRGFVKVMSTAALGALASDQKLTAGEPHSLLNHHMKKKEEVIEWNAHIFSPDLKRYPFHPKATYQPDVSQQPEDPLAAYMSRLDEEGIDKAVIVHPEPYGDDHSLMLDCLKREPDRLRGTSLFYPKDPDAPQKLAALVKLEPHIISTRFHAHRGKENYLDSFADSGVRALWKQAVDLGLIIELHIRAKLCEAGRRCDKSFPGQ
ncbi:putative TIM-barrel fold metal-dependent hydrolase [Catalinimonas alkaloidigena]|uniref:amidohydrolase family protein n=1 Tax=Catalinimonas alkaloidigena TaxID=1075417 RepID=UPI0024055FA4|nr:amidohydrolase family protein [Catalinimonas alkaloidigena]MDF9796960.1 putative TIM-barrel fold metal-dependent hydrolase [Catalinimonas alkaloidigena]